MQFVDVMGVTVVVTTLPEMSQELGGGRAGGTAVVTAYAMAFGGLLMVASRLGDRHGHRRLLVWSVLLFSLASVLAAAASSMVVLAGARALQGAAAAASVPAALRLLTSVIPAGRARQRAVAAWSATGAAAGALGFVVGGSLTQWASWRLVFVVMLVLGVALVAATMAYLPSTSATPDPPVVPWVPGLTLATSIASIVVGATLLGDGRHLGLGLCVLALAAAAAMTHRALERRGAAELVPTAVRRSPNVRWGAVASAANTATTSSSITVATLFLQSDLALSPLRAAGVLLPVSLAVVLASTVAPRLIRARGWSVTTATGLVVIGAGNLAMAATPTPLGIGVASGVCGAGLGLASVAANDLGTTVTTSAKSAAAALLNTTAQSGTAIGTAVALLLAGLLGPRGTWVALAVAAVAVATAALGSGRSGTAARVGAD
ncbi:MFS transporter [Pedococcus bigeumensis]|uniref:MFS transporter n=1 Tax=Pedococcus bigeumensis TaxID=433644 RepID=UPI0031D35E44